MLLPRPVRGLSEFVLRASFRRGPRKPVVGQYRGGAFYNHRQVIIARTVPKLVESVTRPSRSANRHGYIAPARTARETSRTIL